MPATAPWIRTLTALARRLRHPLSMSTTHRSPAFILAASLLSLGCSTTVIGPGSYSSGGSGSGGNGSGGNGSGGSASCESFGDEEPAQAVTVTVRNTGDDPIFLSGQSCTSTIDLTVTDPNGDERTWRNDDCTFTCEALQEHSGVCAADCGIPPVIMIAAGGLYELEWTGVLYEPTEMPEGCFFEPQYPGPQSCHQQLVASAGDYTIATNAWSAASGCQDPSGCNCTPDTDGACQLEAPAFVEGEASTQSGVVTYPSENAVEIVFGN